MKIIVYCKGSVITIESVTCTTVSCQGTNEHHVESESYNPNKHELLTSFPQNNFDVYFNCPTEELVNEHQHYPDGDYYSHWSVRPVFKILIDSALLTDITTLAGKINETNVIDILAVRMETLFRTRYFDYHVTEKEGFYPLTFQPGNENHPRKIEKLCEKYLSFWSKPHENLAKSLFQQVNKILNVPRKKHSQLCNELFQACMLQVASLYHKEKKIGVYFAMLLVALETLQTYDSRKTLNAEDQSKLDILHAKVRAYQPIWNYYNPWEFSLFGHHHNERAKQVVNAILKSDDVEKVQDVLINQKEICEGDSEPQEVSANLLPAKWSVSIKRRTQGGYYRAINRALEVVDQRGIVVDRSYSR